MVNLDELDKLHAAAHDESVTDWEYGRSMVFNAFPALAAELEELRESAAAELEALAEFTSTIPPDDARDDIKRACLNRARELRGGTATPIRSLLRAEAFREASEWFTLRKDVHMILTTLAEAEEAKNV